MAVFQTIFGFDDLDGFEEYCQVFSRMPYTLLHFHLVHFNFSQDFLSTCVLFRNVLFNLKIIWDFPAIFLLFISTLIPLWSEDILLFLFLQMC